MYLRDDVEEALLDLDAAFAVDNWQQKVVLLVLLEVRLLDALQIARKAAGKNCANLMSLYAVRLKVEGFYKSKGDFADFLILDNDVLEAGGLFQLHSLAELGCGLVAVGYAVDHVVQPLLLTHSVVPQLAEGVDSLPLQLGDELHLLLDLVRYVELAEHHFLPELDQLKEQLIDLHVIVEVVPLNFDDVGYLQVSLALPTDFFIALSDLLRQSEDLVPLAQAQVVCPVQVARQLLQQLQHVELQQKPRAKVEHERLKGVIAAFAIFYLLPQQLFLLLLLPLIRGSIRQPLRQAHFLRFLALFDVLFEPHFLEEVDAMVLLRVLAFRFVLLHVEREQLLIGRQLIAEVEAEGKDGVGADRPKDNDGEVDTRSHREHILAMHNQL